MPDPRVGGGVSHDEEVVQALLEVSGRSGEDASVRHRAVETLARIERSVPGSLALAGGSPEELEILAASLQSE